MNLSNNSKSHDSNTMPKDGLNSYKVNYQSKDDIINFSYNSDQQFQPKLIKDPSVQQLNAPDGMNSINQLSTIHNNQQMANASRSISNSLSYSSLP